MDKPPTSAGRLSGFGGSMKVAEYYASDAKSSRKKRTVTKGKAAENISGDNSEVIQELQEEVAFLKKELAAKPKVSQEDLKEALQSLIPPNVFEGIAAWNAAGQQGPIYVPSAGGSNSSHQRVSPVTPQAPLLLVTSTPPAAPAVLDDAHQQVPKIDDTPAALVSTIAELEAITKVIN